MPIIFVAHMHTPKKNIIVVNGDVWGGGYLGTIFRDKLSILDITLRKGYPIETVEFNIVDKTRKQYHSIFTPKLSFWTNLQANEANQLKTKNLLPLFPQQADFPTLG